MSTERSQATSSSQNTSERDYVLGMQSGRSEHQRWRQGGDWYATRALGPYDGNMPLAEVHARFEHEKLTQGFRDGYEAGWRAIGSAT